MPRSLLSLLFFSTFIFLTIAEKEKAWNGHTPPGSDKPAPFTPYWVPEGAKSYDSESPLIHYSGNWVESFSSNYIHKSIRLTTSPKASAKFTFTGTGIEWFGNIDSSHGVSKVYVNNKHAQDVNQYSTSSRKQQRIFWKYDLPAGKHTIKIVNTAKRPGDPKTDTFASLDAFVVMRAPESREGPSSSQTPIADHNSRHEVAKPRVLAAKDTQVGWSLVQKGSTGVHAMQLAVISATHAIIIDKVEHNPLNVDGHPAWAALYNLKTHALKPLRVDSNSFCAGGSFIGNGTLVNVGGNEVTKVFTNSADFGYMDGMQSVRIFQPCDSEDVGGCGFYENHTRLRLATPRWYNTVVRISDGSAMIIGGCKKGGYINSAKINNPTLEYFPPKNIHGANGLPVHLPFLDDTLNANLFPIAFSLPDGKIFMAANKGAMIYDWQNNQERRLPGIPNGVRVTYPMAGTAVLLPLSPDNGYTPEVLVCGGSTVGDSQNAKDISSQDPASSQCVRMVLNEQGINAGWQIEQLPEARHMPDAVLLPTGEVFIVNGAGTGVSGYGNVGNPVGQSNADHPVLDPILYDPSAPSGSRFKAAGSIRSDIPRMYHSVATLTPEGKIMIAGSNPNLDRSEVKYGTEYRVEWASPPYMTKERPGVSGLPFRIGFGEEVKVRLSGPKVTNVKVALMDLGFVTHATHANSRLVYLTHEVRGADLIIRGPPNGGIYPPGPGFIYVLVDGVPSVGHKVLVGGGGSPPVDEGARENMLKETTVDEHP